MNAYATSLIRTAAGYVVAWLVSLPAAPAIEHAAGVTDAQARSALAAGFVLVVGSGYYAAVRRLERRWPKLGRLIGRAAPPAYDWAPPADGGAQAAETIAYQLGAELVEHDPPATPATGRHSAL